MLTSLVSSNLSLTNPQQRGSYWIIRKYNTCPLDTPWVYSTMSVQNFTGQNIYFHSRSTRIKYNYNTTKTVSRIFVFMFKKQFIDEYTYPKIFKTINNYIVAHVYILALEIKHLPVESLWNPPPFAWSEQKESRLTLLVIVNNYKSRIDWLVFNTHISIITAISCKR